MKKLSILLILLPLGACVSPSTQDDLRCKEYGAKAGSSEYINCRATLKAGRISD